MPDIFDDFKKKNAKIFKDMGFELIKLEANACRFGFVGKKISPTNIIKKKNAPFNENEFFSEPPGSPRDLVKTNLTTKTSGLTPAKVLCQNNRFRQITLLILTSIYTILVLFIL
ncbi:MAG: hypothetical protein ACTSRA_09185 [Promethearchaeota archaeon]